MKIDAPQRPAPAEIERNAAFPYLRELHERVQHLETELARLRYDVGSGGAVLTGLLAPEPGAPTTPAPDLEAAFLADVLSLCTDDDGRAYARTHARRFFLSYHLVRSLLRPGARVVDLGSSDRSVFLRLLQRLHPATEIRGYEADLRQPFDLPAGAFDLVLFMEVLEHLSEEDRSLSGAFHGQPHRRVLAQIRGLLRPGGVLLLTTPNASSLDVLLHVLHQQPAYNYAPHPREFTFEEVTHQLGEAGLRPDTAFTFDCYGEVEYPGLLRGHLRAWMMRQGLSLEHRGQVSAFLCRPA